MSSGFTQKIQENCSFQEYALACARNFGALISMRDDPMDASIPDEVEASSYYSENLKKALEKKEKYSLYRPEDWKRDFEEHREKQGDSYLKSIKDNLDLLEKYEIMLAKVRKYVPPTEDHVNYGKFLESQIVESIKFDGSIEYYEKYWKKLQMMHWREWKESILGELDRDIAYYQKQNAEEMARCEERSEWIRQLKESVAKVED